MEKVNLLNLDEAALQDFLKSLGEPAYRSKQILQWVHQYGVSIDEMTNLSKSLRQKLQDSACIETPEIAHEHTSKDGTWKALLKIGPNSFIETVFIPEDDRGTLCISSQVGCALNCSFCSTATQGFSRNLSVAEIIGQLWVAVRKLSKNEGRHDRQITNVVMMGMGEPLLNYDNVVKAMGLMRHDFAYGLSKRRVTLSTSGVVPMMYQLAKDCDVALAVSLHAPNDALRDELVPINKKYPLQVLMQACKNYFANDPRRRVTFEYVMLKGVNDTPAHARQLITILQGVPAKVNLIPFNPFPNTKYERSDLETILRFQGIVHKSGVVTTVRKTRGDDIDAACGQLVGDFVDKTKRRERLAKKIAIIGTSE